MDRKSRIVIWVLVALVLLCACSTSLVYVALRVSRSVTTDPAEVAEQIATYDAPAGYEPFVGFQLSSFAMVALTSRQTNTIICLAQFPKDSNMEQAEMERQMNAALQQGGSTRNVSLQPVAYEDAVICGQPVKLTVSEGEDSRGTRVRQVAGVFEGQNGVILLMIMGPAAYWDQRTIEAFMASIR